MKNLVLIIFVLLCSMCTVEKVSAHSFSSAAEDAAVVVNQPELSIKQAIELAYPSAQKWNKKAQLLQAINIDLDLPGNSDGSNGKRKFWNISFGIPDTNKFFLVTIHEGKIDKAQELTGKGDTPKSKNEFVKLEDIHYDSPKLLKKALEMGTIYPGKEWAKGYNFMLSKDTVTNRNQMLVVGWNKKQTKMKAAGFDSTTGEPVPPQF